MRKSRPQLKVERRGGGFLFAEVGSKYEVYHGRVYCLRSDNYQYALIFDQEVPAGLSPPIRQQHLLNIGTYAPMGRDWFIQQVTEKAAREQAQKLATEKGLVLRFAPSQPKCTPQKKVARERGCFTGLDTHYVTEQLVRQVKGNKPFTMHSPSRP
jgi:hypothetical protein